MNLNDKYAPKSFADLVIENDDVRKRLQEYATGQRTDHLILHGPRGTGKSSAARIIAESISGDTGTIKTFNGANFDSACFQTILNGWSLQRYFGVEKPVEVVEEIDLLGQSEKYQLRAFIDRHNWGRIIGTTNNLQILDAALKDRFDTVEIAAACPDAWCSRAADIMRAEGVSVSDAVIGRLLGGTNGSIRDIMRALQDYAIDAKAMTNARLLST